MPIFEVEGLVSPERCTQYQSKFFMSEVDPHTGNKHLESCLSCQDGKSRVS